MGCLGRQMRGYHLELILGSDEELHVEDGGEAAPNWFGRTTLTAFGNPFWQSGCQMGP
jgi:hypothetical protein